VVDTEMLRDAQANPDQYRDLLVRVAGYSDYFVDMGTDLQEEVIARTAQEAW
jgi:formate C-acetyltransferase